MRYDFCIIGGGIVGLSTALALLRRRPGASLVLLEKEDALARHQTGHNSGVIHAGVYYAPGSLKARLCREGSEATKAFCREHAIPYEVCGKLIVATGAEELDAMAALHERARENRVGVERLTREELHSLEPNVTGVGALLVRETGIVDYRRIAQAMGGSIRAAGGEIRTGEAVMAIREQGGEVEVRTPGAVISADRLVCCAGLQSDRLARLAGLATKHRIVPFRGEYYRLPAARSGLVSHLIYPVPNPELPFLGIHLTRMIDGGVTLGPNAVLGLAREGYPKLSLNIRDAADIASFPGLWQVLGRYWRASLSEAKNSLWRRGYLDECRKYCPSLQLSDLTPYPAGIRAQAVLEDGTLVHDFLFAGSERMLHVLNAPSPAATSALPIGAMIADRLLGSRPPSGD